MQYLFAVTTGVRLGEMLGLRWQDVDLKEGCVCISQTLQHASTGLIFEEPKSKSSRRKISIPLVTIAALSKAKSALGDIVPPSSLCFVATNGSPIQPKNYHRWWTALQKEANAEWQSFEKKKKALLGKGFSKDSDEYTDLDKAQNALKFHKKFHALRHTHATILLANGEPVIEVSRRLGHSKPSVTLDIYEHAIPGHDQKIADKIAGLYGI